MAITAEQLRKLQDIRAGLEGRRNSEKGDMWQKLSRYVLPELAEKDERKPMFSTAASQCTSIAANALQGWAYGRTIGWMHIAREDERVKGGKPSRDEGKWFEACEKVMLDDLSRSSFYDEALSFTKVTFNLSTGIMTMDWDETENMPVFENLNPRRCCIAQDANHNVDVLFHQFEMDKDECEMAFGDKAPQKIRDSKDWSRTWTFTKAIFPATRYDIDVDGEGDWCEVIWCEDDRKNACSERRLMHKPFLCWRFNRSLTGSAWGIDSPGESMVEQIVALNVMEKASLKGAQLRLTPPIKATEGLEVNIVPEGIIEVSGNEDFQYAPPPGSTEETLVQIQKKEKELREAYYVDFFLVLQQTMENQKTATEAALLSDEKSQIMSSFASRLNREFLEAALETLFQMEERHGRLPAPPESMLDQEIRIDFISPLSIAQKKAQTYAPARQFLAETLAFAEIDPSVRYIFKIPEYAQSMAEDLKISLDFINSPEEVQQKVDQDRQMAEQQMQMQNAQQGAQTMAALSKAPEDGSIAQAMTGMGANNVQGGR